MRANLTIKEAILVLTLLLIASCGQQQGEGVFSVDCHCSIVQLTVGPEKFNGDNIRVVGFAVRSPRVERHLQLYQSADDARYLNDANSIWVDLRGFQPSNDKLLEEISFHFVVVDGTFFRSEGSYVLADIHDVRQLSPVPLDESRFAPGIVVEPIDKQIGQNK